MDLKLKRPMRNSSICPEMQHATRESLINSIVKEIDNLVLTPSNNAVFIEEDAHCIGESPAEFKHNTYWLCLRCNYAENSGALLICRMCQATRLLSMPSRPQPAQSLPKPPLIIQQSKSEYAIAFLCLIWNTNMCNVMLQICISRV